jgi:hypothetical protein
MPFARDDGDDGDDGGNIAVVANDRPRRRGDSRIALVEGNDANDRTTT